MFELDHPTDTAVLAADITTNTTTQSVRGRTGYKTFWAEVIGTGAVTATVTIYAYPYYYVTTSNVTGTGATVRVEVFY